MESLEGVLDGVVRVMSLVVELGNMVLWVVRSMGTMVRAVVRTIVVGTMVRTLRFRVVAMMAAVMSLIILSAQEVHAQVVIDAPSFQAPPPPGLFSTPGAPAAPRKEVATWVHWQGWEAAP